LVCEPKVSLTNENKIKVVNFRIACSRKFRSKNGSLKEETCFVSITAWTKLAEMCENNLKNKDIVYVEGSLQSKNLNDSKITSVEILADKIQILTPKNIIPNKKF